ncbi:hypothetical protein O6H91_Y144600 [Diphasiastrum complanatum]|nr:hypothetical protein O6H91_Y144600 [Diphasiastrum complanatum]
MVMAVFVLYVRCAAVNPADPGVGCSNFYPKASSSHKLESVQDIGTHETQSWKENSLHKAVQNSGSQEAPADSKVTGRVKARNWSELVCLPFQGFKSLTQCACVGQNIQQSVTQEELVYCGLCKAQISKYSKHCRACDKCVEVLIITVGYNRLPQDLLMSH